MANKKSSSAGFGLFAIIAIIISVVTNKIFLIITGSLIVISLIVLLIYAKIKKKTKYTK